MCDYYIFFFGVCFLYFVSHRFGNFVLIPFIFLIKPKMRAIWWEKDLLRWGFSTCPWFNFSIICRHVYILFLAILFLGCFDYLKKKKIRKHWKFSKSQKYFILCFVFCFFFSLRITLIMISLSWLRTYLILWRNIESMCCIIKCISYF